MSGRRPRAATGAAIGNDPWRARVQAALGDAFVLERELAGGPRSRVFVGSETALGRRVVLKMLIPNAPGTDEDAEFRREAMTAARLHHPHIVPVFSIGTVAGVPYYTMPFIEGESLRSRLERVGAMAVEPALRVFREIASALAFAHELGVIHRDVKPENIALERATGRALLGDFGIACPLGASRRVTPAGTTVGTPVYMSPEQVDGLELDGRTDVYSLGLVVWEMLTGARPWIGESLYEVMYRQKHDALPRLDAYGVQVPQSVVEAIERALRKDRHERCASMGDLIAAMEAPAPIGTPPDAWTHPRGDARADVPGDLPPRAPAGAMALSSAAGRSKSHDSSSLATPAGEDAKPVPDPTTAATMAMAVWRGLRWSRPDVPHQDVSHQDRLHRDVPRWDVPRTIDAPEQWPEEDTRLHGASHARWIVAACGALAVTAGLVAAMTVRHDIVRWTTVSGDVTAQGPTSVADSTRVDTIPMDAAAAQLASVHLPPTPPAPTPVAPRQAPPGARDSAPAPATSVVPVVAPARRRRASSAPRAVEERLSPHDAVRARAATATLALEAYEGALGVAAQGGSEPLGITDSSAPALAVRVPARRRAASATGSASILAPDSTAAAIAVRVTAHSTPR